MDREEYLRALAVRNEPVSLLTRAELCDRVELLARALQYKAWRGENDVQRLRFLRPGESVLLQVGPEEVDDIWPHCCEPIVEVLQDGTVKVSRPPARSRMLGGVILVTFVLLALAVHFG